MRPAPATTPPPIQQRAGTVPPATGADEEAEPRFTIDETRHYRLITPLFGGGAAPSVADPVTPIRGSSIRGQLRFWWRACLGGEFNEDLRAMKAEEDLLWGAASTPANPRPSKVQLSVNIVKEGRPFTLRDARGNVLTDNRGREVTVAHYRSPYSYAAFPLQGEPGAVVLEGIEFTLHIQASGLFAKEKRGVEAAVWAWETLGGIGARTRRGFGALQCLRVNDAPSPLSTVGEIGLRLRDGLRLHVSSGKWPKSVPHLTQTLPLRLTHPQPSALAAWAALLQGLKTFRQARQGNPGRSRWPEPDEIRRLTRQSHPTHARPIVSVPKFPRAVLGLPIIFHFKDEDKRNPTNPHADPRQTTLQGARYDRRASPLILRPLACAHNEAVGLATILLPIDLPPGGIVLNDAAGTPGVEAALTAAEATQILPLHGKTSVLLACLASIEGTYAI